MSELEWYIWAALIAGAAVILAVIGWGFWILWDCIRSHPEEIRKWLQEQLDE